MTIFKSHFYLSSYSNQTINTVVVWYYTMYFGWSKYFDSLLISSISRHCVIVPLTYTNAVFLTALWLIPLARDCQSKHSLNKKGYIYVLNIKIILITLFATCSFLKGYQFQMSSFWQFQYNLKLIITRQLT